MLTGRFYWGTIRKAVIAFGNMFNDITIDRRDSTGSVVQVMRVPLSYAPRQKFLARIEQLPNPDNPTTQIILPRMSFEMVGMNYDFNRKVSPIQQTRGINASGNTVNTQYVPTPYNIQMNLYLYAKNQDDGLQVIEQILPYFNPDYNLSLKTVPELDITNDLPIILNDIQFEDSYDGDFTARRSIIWTLSFTMKLNFFGPVNKTGVIRKVFANTFSNAELTSSIQNYAVEPSPTGANINTQSGYIETFEDF